MNISKLEAAKTQIETAINLYFYDRDSVSIHTLTGASNQILRDIGKLKGLDSLKEEFLKRTKPEKVKEMEILLNNTQNFFKHADRDPDGTIDFNSEETYIYLFDCCLMYERLTSVENETMKVFTIWVRLTTPDMFIWDNESRNIYNKFTNSLTHLDVISDKKRYFETMITLTNPHFA